MRLEHNWNSHLMRFWDWKWQVELVSGSAMCEVVPSFNSPSNRCRSYLAALLLSTPNPQSILVWPAHRSGSTPAAHISARMTELSHFWPAKHHFWHHSHNHTCLHTIHSHLSNSGTNVSSLNYFFCSRGFGKGKTKILLLVFPGLFCDPITSFFLKKAKNMLFRRPCVGKCVLWYDPWTTPPTIKE